VPADNADLIDVQQLHQLLAGSEPPTVLDVRWSLAGGPGREEYETAHVPGAAFVDLEQALSGPAGSGGRHPLPEADAFETAMRQAGVSSSRPVVVYDAADATAAARAWWCLRYFGHRDVRVLDGGFAAWTAAGFPTSQQSAAAAAGDFVARPGQMPMLSVEQAAALARDGLLLDARAAERYRGDVEPVDPVGGHIPGAISAPTGENVGPDGRLRPPQELRRRFEALGATGAEVGVYCGSGVTAAHQVLALSRAGVPAALYVGSWSHWVTDPARPVATGGDPG
jgi:thiosulfate/3-mercaptopyruvate sulfurtransferase